MVNDIIRPQSSVMIMGQNPGREEELTGTPFVGKTGQVMEKFFFPLSGLTRDDVSIGNAVRCRVGDSNDLPELNGVDIRKALQHCHLAYFRPPEKLKVILAQGMFALHALTGKGIGPKHSLTHWRGYALPLSPPWAGEAVPTSVWTPKPADIVVLPTWHLAGIMHEPDNEHSAKMDWAKLPRVRDGRWPRIPPPYRTDPLLTLAGEVSFDTEWDVNDPEKKLLRYSAAWGDQVRVVEAKDFQPIVLQGQSPTLIGQNWPVDMEAFQNLVFGLKLAWTPKGITFDDTMYMHSVLWPGLDHDLNFLGSIYSDINRWKHLAQVNPIEYSAMDAYGTLVAWSEMKREFARDSLSWDIYTRQMRPLIHMIYRAETTGQRVDQERVMAVHQGLKDRCEMLRRRAQAIAGWPLNIASPAQVSRFLYNYERIGLKVLIHQERITRAAPPGKPIERRS